MIFQKSRGQTSLEYSVMILVIIGALIAAQNYIKRGLQGRWKAHVDELGEQYDPRTADTDLRQTLLSQTNTQIISMNTSGGFWTLRTDSTISTEKKTGQTSVGAY